MRNSEFGSNVLEYQEPKSQDSKCHVSEPKRTVSDLQQEIRSLTNSELLLTVQNLAQEERRITVEVLRHLREVERRQLFAELGYQSLFAYCTQALKYSESAACRRIEAMRAMRETQEIETMIEFGELSLSTVAQARTVMRRHEKISNTRLSVSRKKDVMFSLCGQSKRVAEKNLAAEFPLAAVSPVGGVVSVIKRQTSVGTTRVTIEFTEEEMKVFDEINRLVGRPQNLKDVVLRLAAKELFALRKARGEAENTMRGEVSSFELDKERVESSRMTTDDSLSPAVEKKPATPVAGIVARHTKKVLTSRSRGILAATKRYVWRRADGRCEYVGSDGKRCEGRHSLEYDHRVPFACGGLSTEENLRLYCRQHNALAATQVFGRVKMAQYYQSLS